MNADRLRQVLDYDPATGVFRWKTQLSPRGAVGSVAGRAKPCGYRQISIDKKLYYAHRLAWLYVTGKWPVDQIDHIDGRRSHNAFANLRECVQTQNNQNQAKLSRNSTGELGVTWDKQKNKYRAQIGVSGRNLNLGLHATVEKAAIAYSEAKAQLHTFSPKARNT